MNFFRNLMLYRIPLIATDDLRATIELEEKLSSHVLRDPGAMELASDGFVPPVSGDLCLCADVSDATLLSIGIAERVMPASAVAKAVRDRVERHTEECGEPPTGRHYRDLRDAVKASMLPQAFIRTRTVRGYVDRQTGFVVIDTANRQHAETWISRVRNALGSFPAVPVHSDSTPHLTMRGWLMFDPLPSGLAIGEDADLVSIDDASKRISLRGRPLLTTELQVILEDGATVKSLQVRIDDRCQFVLRDDLSLRRFVFDDVVSEPVSEIDGVNVSEFEHALYTLQVLETRRLLAWLHGVFNFDGEED